MGVSPPSRGGTIVCGFPIFGLLERQPMEVDPLVYAVLFLSLLFLIHFFIAGGSLPRFAERVPNVTVAIGKDALLACVVDDLKSFKVSSTYFRHAIALLPYTR